LYWVQHVLSLFPSTHAIRLSALLFCLLTGSVSAQPIEAVTVEDSSVAGVWKFTAPQGFSASLLGKTRWGPMTDEFCEIEKIRTAMTVHCPGLHFDGADISRGTVRLNDNHLRLTWGSMLHHVAITGTIRPTGQFEGRYSLQNLGIASEAPDKVTGEKLTLSASTPDTASKSGFLARVLSEMAQGALTVPLDPRATTVKILKPDTLHSLGSVQSIIYVGEKNLSATADSFVIYDVEFANGHLICELRQATDDRLSYFDCG